MRDAEISLEEALINALPVIGRVIRLAGIIVVSDDRISLKAGEADDSRRIAVRDQSLLDRIIDNVPCCIGGECLYHDRVKIEVVLRADEEGEVFVAQVGSVTIERDGEIYEF